MAPRFAYHHLRSRAIFCFLSSLTVEAFTGTWLATFGSGLKKNKLTPEDGQVFQVNNLDGIKQFPVNPLDAAYFTLLDRIEQEMMKLLGISEPMQGQAGAPIRPRRTTSSRNSRASPSAMRFRCSRSQSASGPRSRCGSYQNYTHEHFVEVEAADGTTSWRAASALAVRGKYAVNVDAAPMLAYSEYSDMGPRQG